MRGRQDGKLFAAIATARKRADQILVLPGEATEEDGYTTTLFRCKSSLDWAVKMCWLLQVPAIFRKRMRSASKRCLIRIILNLDEIRRHKILRQCMNFCGWL